MVLARWHGLLTKQAYLSTISLLKSAEFPCCLFAHEKIKWPTAANWIIVGYIVVINRCLIEPGCLTKKTPGFRCLSHMQIYTHQRKCHMLLSNFSLYLFGCFLKDCHNYFFVCTQLIISGKAVSYYGSYSLIFTPLHCVINRKQHKKQHKKYLYNQSSFMENLECSDR